MATLVLTAVGTAIGGPIGGAVGALIGQQVDAVIFAPKSRQGPRLGELAVQTSSYGTAIPKIFGTMRVAGTVIWSTDLQEHSSTSGGGKGQPEVVTYTYFVSFAVALSARPVKEVRRIWADGKLLRGSAGDFKTRVKFRLHKGTEDQALDPLIASVEGAAQTPAFRGIAYAVFEDLDLTDFGNRIPSITFELMADDMPVPIGKIAHELSAGEVSDGSTPSLIGYAASGDSVRAALEALTDIVPLSLVEDGGTLMVRAGASSQTFVSQGECGARAGENGGGSEVMRRSASAVPGEASITYHDQSRDYQTGVQRATLGAGSLKSDRRALPAVLSADTAKGLVEYRLENIWAGRATARIHLGWRRSDLRPGTKLRLEGQAGLWKVERWSFERMAIRVDLLGIPSSGVPEAVASSGRPIGHRDELVGTTVLRLLEVSMAGEGASNSPRLLALAAGTGAAWRRAALSISFDGGQSWSAVGSTAPPAVMGHALSALAPAGSALFDGSSSLDVELLTEAMWLEGRSDAALIGGANLAVLGDELLQFGHVEALGQRCFRLSRLLRGRRGTEWAAVNHVEGEPFALLHSSATKIVDVPFERVGAEVRLTATGLGDQMQGVTAVRVLRGEALGPPSPVHLNAEQQPSGDVAIRWVRRSRSGWAWPSGSDTPLGEEKEDYALTISGAGRIRQEAASNSSYVYTAAAQETDGNTGTLQIEVAQIGALASSRPAQTTLSR